MALSSGIGLFLSVSSYYLSYVEVYPISIIYFSFWISSLITMITIAVMLFAIKDILT